MHGDILHFKHFVEKKEQKVDANIADKMVAFTEASAALIAEFIIEDEEGEYLCLLCKEMKKKIIKAEDRRRILKLAKKIIGTFRFKGEVKQLHKRKRRRRR